MLLNKMPKSISYLDIAKFAILVFVIYSFWYFGIFGASIPLLYGAPIIATLFVLFDMSKNKRSYKLGFYSIVPLFFVYCLYSFISGLIVHYDFSYLVSSLTRFSAYTVLFYDICYISKVDNSMNWIIKILSFVSLVCSLYTIFRGISVRGSYGTQVIVMGEHTNTNTLGVIMVIGMFTTLYIRKNKGLLITLLVLFSELYVIVLSASRKALIAGLILLVLWEIELLVNSDKEIKMKFRIFGLLVLFIGVFVTIIYLRYYYYDSSLYVRMLNFESGVKDRTDLIQKSVQLWKTSPFVGIGFDQVRKYIGLYSHNTYVELLACSGLLGVSIWSVFFVIMLKRIFVVLNNYRKTNVSYQLFFLFIMLLIELFLGMGQIWFYDFEHMVILCVIFGSFRLVDLNSVINKQYNI